MPATGYSSCVENNLSTMIDPATGTFKIRRDGPPARGQQAQAQPRRRLPPPLVPRLPLLHRLRDDGPDQLRQQPDAGRRPTAATSTARSATAACTEIQFAAGDAINGPFHTNDDILTCGGPTFGRNSADSIEFSGPAPGYTQLGGSSCSGAPVFKGPRRAGVKALTMPPTNTTLSTVATSGGLVYQGKTTIRFNGSPSNNMTVTNALVNGGSPQTRALPANGVIYVQNRSGGCGSQPPPSDATYAEPAPAATSTSAAPTRRA